MKMEYRKDKTNGRKKTFLVFFAAIYSMLIFTGCPDSFMNHQNEESKAFPFGMGSITLRIDGSALRGRAIIPNTLPDFHQTITHYRLSFSSDTFYESFKFAKDENMTVPLEAGTYNLTVAAYNGEDSVLPVAISDSQEITIIAGQDVSGEVLLKFINTEDGIGTFSWEIDLPDGISEAYMAITPQSSTAEQFESYFDGDTPLTMYFASGNGTDELTGNLALLSGSLELPSGHYDVVFTMNKDNCRPVVWHETLHIYQNMESRFKHEFTDYVFLLNIYTVTFNYDDGTINGELGPLTERYLHDETVTEPDNPLRVGYNFDGWYTDDESFEDEWNFDTSINKHLDLYAKWLNDPNAECFDPIEENDKTYNGEPQGVNVRYADADSDPVMNNETAGAITVYYSGTASDGTVYAESTDAPVKAGTYEVYAATGGGTSYSAIPRTYFGLLTINRRDLTITGVSAEPRDYDRTDSVVLKGGALVNFIEGDDIGFILGEGTMQDANAGDSKIVTTGIQLTGDDKDNYTLEQPDITVNIAKATPVVTFPASATLTYGQTLAQAVLDGQSSEVEGAFAFISPSTQPTVLFNGSSQEMLFTPNDTANYNTVTGNAIITVNRAPIANAAITVTAPVKNAGPVTSAPAGGTGYFCGTVSWSPGHSPFMAQTEYTATVTLTAGANYVFAETVNATINGNTATVTANSGTSITLSYTFGETAASAITITTQPVAANVTFNSITGSLTLATTVDGGAEINGYQWYRNSANNNAGGELIGGATNASFNIPTHLTAGTYYYYCVVSATLGAAPTASNTATVTVAKAAGANVQTPATRNAITDNSIIVNSATLAGSTGQSIEYAISASGTTAPQANGDDWKSFDGPIEFGSLAKSTIYYVWARSASSENYNAGAPRPSVGIMTSLNHTFNITFENLQNVASLLPWQGGGNGDYLNLVLGEPGSITLTLPTEGFSGANWYVDSKGIHVTGREFTLNSAQFTRGDVGIYPLTLEVNIDGIWYYRTIELRVSETPTEE